jgi:hypothetical protein
MTEGRTAGSTAQRLGSGLGRLVRAWRVLPYERRLAAGAALGLFVSLFLPWYQETALVPGKSPSSASVTGWGAFSFVEAAILLVAVGVLTLLFQRAEGRAFHLPGGDGWVIMAAGVWTTGLVIWRIFDKQSTSSNKSVVGASGIEWGIFVALAVAGFLAYAGSRIRAAHRPEPPLPGEGDAAAEQTAAPPRRPASLRLDDAPTRRRRRRADVGDGPTRAPAPEEHPGDELTRARTPQEHPGDEPTRAPAPRDADSPAGRPLGWLTAKPEGHEEPADPPARERAGWSYDDDLRDNDDEPPPRRRRPRPEDYHHDDPPSRPTRRRRPPPDDQLTMRLPRDD